MKKSLLAVAALTAFAGAAQAQSSVTVYGILDVGVMGATNSPNLNSGSWGVPGPSTQSGSNGLRNGTVWGGMAGGESQSRLGFKGSEDLGGGTKAIFLLETGFNPMTGSIANTGLAGGKTTAGGNYGGSYGDSALQGQLFGRGAYAGLEGQYGTITAGRQQNLMLDNIGGYDPVNAQMFSPLAYSGSYGGGGYTDESRVNQAFKYVYKTNGFNGNLLYAPGGISSSSGTGATQGAQLGYETSKWGVQAIYSRTSDATSISAATGANAVAVTLANTAATQITAKYNVTDNFAIKAGFERMNVTAPSNFQQYSGMNSTVSGYSISTLSAYSGSDTKSNVYWVGGNYDLTPAIKLSLAYYSKSQIAQGNVASGTQSIEAAMVEYYMSKRTNLYAAVSNGNFGGATQISPTAGATLTNTIGNMQVYGLGMRHTF